MLSLEQARETCLSRLIWAFEQLKAPPDPCAELADLIVEPMMGVWRFFHTPEHLFEVGGDDDAIEMIAALFHDLVYVQVDHSINFNISHYITPWIREDQSKLWVRDRAQWPPQSQTQTFDWVSIIFGIEANDALNPYAGQNELLSALVAARSLEPWLPMTTLLAIVACIEATIPFRPMVTSERLFQRLEVVNDRWQLGLGKPDLTQMVERAVRVANRDVLSFAHPSSAHFLANTWNLLPETNHNLTPDGAYRISDYRVALIKMERFFNGLDSGLIFRTYGDEPSPAEHHERLARAEHNLAVGRLYLQCKIVSIVFLEAVSLGIGVDVPLGTMMGELTHRELWGLQVECFLPDSHEPPQNLSALHVEVWGLLVEGRAEGNNKHDLITSPLTAFWVKTIGFAAMGQQRIQSDRWLDRELTDQLFLANFDRDGVVEVLEAIGLLFEHRKLAVATMLSLAQARTV
jgi:hypothetical protein